MSRMTKERFTEIRGYVARGLYIPTLVGGELIAEIDVLTLDKEMLNDYLKVAYKERDALQAELKYDNSAGQRIRFSQRAEKLEIENAKLKDRIENLREALNIIRKSWARDHDCNKQKAREAAHRR